MERLAKRRVLVDPERLCTPGIPPPGCVPAPVPLRAGARGERCAGLRLQALCRARERACAGDLPKAGNARDALPRLRGAQTRSALLPVGIRGQSPNLVFTYVKSEFGL